MALTVFALFTVSALIGYATFGRHPALLAGLPSSLAAFHGRAFAFFAQGHVWLAGAVLAVPLVRRVGWRFLPALAVLYAISLAAELAGTGWGIPFGAYTYTSALGAGWLDRVPVVIPLSWFCMALPAYALAAHAFPGGGQRVHRVLVGALALVAWDLALDPAMSHVTFYWRWAEAGPYYGMPLLNLFGWAVTGAALMAALEALSVRRWTALLPRRWLHGYWAVNLALPLGLCAAGGAWGAVLLTGVVVAGLGALLAATAHTPTAAPSAMRSGSPA